MKYYYTCGVKAAWMCKNYDIKILCNGKLAKSKFYSPTTLANYGTRKGYKNAPLVKYYVAPESMHLLEPKTGDWGRSKIGEACFFCFEQWRSHRSFSAVPDAVNIILRNNKVFHAPEWEE